MLYSTSFAKVRTLRPLQAAYRDPSGRAKSLLASA